ncbi:MAG TPA: aminotransferase class V-fold PLP-dependent enzyme [Phycisphaerales bacterium]|nr:aminotransferase class V-fold PLP-dependent enzyme [Phycisphaerales bacterium]
MTPPADAHPDGSKPIPAYSPLAEHFLVDRGTVFLNHGSFGNTPRVVLEEQDSIRRRVEREPVRFFVEDLEPLLDTARAGIASFVGCPAEDLAFVVNATEGVNTVVRSLDLKPGDVVITGTHEYNACSNALRYVADRAGATVLSVPLPCPIDDESQVVDALVRAVEEAGPAAKLLLLSHITSPSGVVLPVAPIIQRVQGMGVDVMLDSAHAPGFVDFNIGQLAPAYCTANLHKWCCAPKGSAVLYVRPDRQQHVRPLTISHGANSPRTDRSRFRLEFDMTGSRDYSAWLAAPRAVEMVGGLMDGWPRVRESGAALAKRGGEAVSRRLERWGEGRLLAPDRMLGAMRALTLPKGPGAGAAPTRYHDDLQDRLIDRWKVQVPVHSVALSNGLRQRVLRLSAAVYNTPEQYEYLAQALEQELIAEGC